MIKTCKCTDFGLNEIVCVGSNSASDDEIWTIVHVVSQGGRFGDLHTPHFHLLRLTDRTDDPTWHALGGRRAGYTRYINSWTNQ